MANTERNDRDLNLNEQADFYDDDSMYEELYADESFGERVDSARAGEVDTAAHDDMAASPEQKDSRVEDDFGEAINPATNPHLDDQLGDEKLSSEAEADYADDKKDDGIVAKAKNKIGEITGSSNSDQ